MTLHSNVLNSKRGSRTVAGLARMLSNPDSAACAAYAKNLAATGLADARIAGASCSEAERLKTDLRMEATAKLGALSATFKYGISVKKSAKCKGSSAQVGRGWAADKAKNEQAAALLSEFLGLGSKTARVGVKGSAPAERDMDDSRKAAEAINASPEIQATLVALAMGELSRANGRTGSDANILHIHSGQGDTNGMRGLHRFASTKHLAELASQCKATAVSNGRGASVKIQFKRKDDAPGAKPLSALTLKRKGGGGDSEKYPDHLQIMGQMRGLKAMIDDLGALGGTFRI
jgi:hypothetical protein